MTKIFAFTSLLLWKQNWFFHKDPRFDIRSVQIVEGIPNVTAIQLDVMDSASLCNCISQVQLSLGSIFCRYLNWFFRKHLAVTLLNPYKKLAGINSLRYPNIITSKVLAILTFPSCVNADYNPILRHLATY